MLSMKIPSSRLALFSLALILAACSAPPTPPVASTEVANVALPAVQVAGGTDATAPEQGKPTPPGSAAGENPTPMPPTSPPSATPTSVPSPTATATPTATPEPVVVEGVTIAEAEVYAGPGDIFPWMGAYSTGITLTVLGSDDSTKWLAIEIPPQQTGWVAASDMELIDPPAELALAPTPAALPTTAPLIGSAIQLTLVKEYHAPTESFHGYQAAIAIVQTSLPKVPFTLEMINANGKVVFREKSMTDATGKISIYIPWRQAEGVYRVVVTTESGDHDEGSIEIKVIK